MKRTRLAPEDLELWYRVAERTERLGKLRRLDPENNVADPKPKPPRPAAKRHDAANPPKPAPRRTNYELLPTLSERFRNAPVQMDQKAFGKLKRGKLVPEARIDLHGMTLERAHPALTRFILASSAEGKRLVLVITGKGKDRDEGGPIPIRHGVLRHQVPQWLSMPPLRSVVLQIAPAHVSHGGSGAYYVYLRRQR